MSDSIYRQLCRQAAALLRRETSDHRLEPADLLHEALLRIDRSPTPIHFQGESHAIALAMLVMRRILVDRTRGTDLHMRVRCVPLDSGLQTSRDPNPEAEPLHDVLDYMQTSEAHLYGIVQMRFFLGLGIEEIAKVLSISSRTVKRDWRDAREWLRSELLRREKAPVFYVHSS
jgi:RNA polymerase sigma-70 factor, ECF subfamily